jgi:uncharacterized membrane protein YfcA
LTHLTLINLGLLTFSSVIAGVVDTLAGGGGLITVPALLLSGVPPVLALGTNKLQSCLCEATATVVFRKKTRMHLGNLKIGLIFTLMGSIFGTLLLQVTTVGVLKKLVPFFLLVVFIMNLLTKPKDAQSAEGIPDSKRDSRLMPLGIAIGFYNGFFGPGTGTIWAVALRKFLNLNLKNATMMAKPLNLVGNLTALTIFFASGQIDWIAGISMGLGAVAGGLIGANLVILKDARWLKLVFNVLMAISVAGAFFAP